MRKVFHLGLSGIREIPEIYLVTIGCFFGSRVEIPEVNRLTPKGAKVLSVLDAELALNGIIELPLEIAYILSEHTGTEYEIKYEEQINECDSVMITETRVFDALELNGILNLDAETATALARHRGNTLRLNGITSLSDDAAEALSHYEGCLDLLGLQAISPRGAQFLLNATGDNLNVNFGDNPPDLLAQIKGSSAKFVGELRLR